MSITGFHRGHKIYYEELFREWRFSDNHDVLVKYNEDFEAIFKGEDRPCIKCNSYPTKEGYDACLGKIEGATSACCGHGVEEAFSYNNITGEWRRL